MFIVRAPDQIDTWLVGFWTYADHWLAKRLPGRFKHVTAIGRGFQSKTWVWLDLSHDRFECSLIPDTPDGRAYLGARTQQCAEVLRVPGRGDMIRPPRLGLLCVPFVRRVVGVPGSALLPDGFRQDCLRAGAEVVIHGSPEAAAA